MEGVRERYVATRLIWQHASLTEGSQMTAAVNKITQFIPGFFSLDAPPESSEFTSIQELEAIPFVKRWKESKDFIRFSVSYNNPLPLYLMAEMTDGRWVVGYVQNPIDLPIWEGP